MQIEKLDHLALTVKDIAAASDFYQKVLGMKAVTFAGGRKALRFASGKINLHEAGCEFEPKALQPTPGSADLCFITNTPLTAVMDHLRAHSISIIEGPIQKTGSNGMLLSIYFRDPDGNLVEVSNQEQVNERRRYANCRNGNRRRGRLLWRQTCTPLRGRPEY